MALVRGWTQLKRSDGPICVASNKRDGYEVRSYNESKWVGTNVLGTSWKDATEAGIGRLLGTDSRAGTNAGVPIVTKIVPGQGPTCDNTFQVLMHVPDIKAPPISTPFPMDCEGASLAVVNMPAVMAYVAEYSGPLCDQIMIEQAEKLAGALSRDGVTFSEAYYYTTLYDNAIKTGDQFMEVWFTDK